jgi:3-oxoadipate enol-lactonase
MQLPPGRLVNIPGRGQTFIRELEGPANAPTLMLLHGWTATADLNWFTAFHALGEHFRVVALDHRGHGRGIRAKGSFRLEDCADDVAALADVLGINNFIPVGYSMGGTIAQLVWKRHETRVRGLVLCSTAAHFTSSREERLGFLGLTGLAALVRLTPAQARDWLTEQLYLQRRGEELEEWAISQMSTHDWRHILEAVSSLGSFNSLDWLGTLDAPTSIILTLKDTVVPIERQQRLVEAIKQASVHHVDAGHNAIYTAREQYVPVLVSACREVHQRSLVA